MCLDSDFDRRPVEEMCATMKIKANGITINYRIDGPDDAPCLVFSNSLATSLAMWDEQAEALKDKFRVLRYDQRGHGGSDVPSGRYAYDTLLADALGLLDAIGIGFRIGRWPASLQWRQRLSRPES